MSAKKWCVMLLSVILFCICVWGAVSALVDPFGIFGDLLFHWDAYSMTNNPRVGKIEYLERSEREYSTFVIGSSSAAGYNTERIEAYLGGDAYNAFCYGTNIAVHAAMAEYLLKAYAPERIILNIGINEANTYAPLIDSLTGTAHNKLTGQNALSFYLPYLFADIRYSVEKIQSYRADTALPQPFDVFVPETGCYDKRVRDVEPIHSPEEYGQLYSALFPIHDKSLPLPYIDECVDSVAQIKRMCENAGVELVVLFSPVSQSQLSLHSDETLTEFFTKLAKVTDYWNFAVSSVSYDSRYFYDSTHFRNAAGDMALARVYGDTGVYVPDDYGVYTTRENAAQVCGEWFNGAAYEPDRTEYTATVPILMYHHIAKDHSEASSDTTAAGFRHQMELLLSEGYNPVSLQSLIEYVYSGAPLPENPVCITFDDGYDSVYKYAFPILKELGIPATYFVIGVTFGETETYKDTGAPITPHFGIEAAREMLASGIISIQSHTFDLHQVEQYDGGASFREGALVREGETDTEYLSALMRDHMQINAILEDIGAAPCLSFAFPYGKTSPGANVALKSEGVLLTLSTDPDTINSIVRGLPQSLVDLGRLNMTDSVSDDALLSYLSRGKQR